MTISNSYNFSLTRNDIIQAALEEIGAIGVGETITAADEAKASLMLNMLVKSWDAKGLHCWKETEATLLLQGSQQKYLLGNATTDANATETLVQTTLSASALTSATTIVVTSASGMTIGDVIGIEQDDDTIKYTTISNIASTTITLLSALTDAATSGNYVYTYTSRITKPVDITDVRRVTSDGYEIILDELGSEEYFSYPNKAATGMPTAYCFSPGLANSSIYLWPVSDDMTVTIKFRYAKQLADFDAATDTPDFPQEWYLALVKNLALVLARPYGRSDLISSLAQEALMELQDILDWDTEHSSVSISPAHNPSN
jgi:hypothetical protein